jgi:hypothetical protein
MLFNAKWENESCSMPNEWVIVVQCKIRECKLFTFGIKQLSFSHLALNSFHSLIWHWTTFILSFGIEQHSFSHLALNNNYSLIWHLTTFILSFGIEQHSFSHLALNNIHSLIWHWTTFILSFNIGEWLLFNAK